MNQYIIRQPVITERSMLAAQTLRTYTFLVAPVATKKQVAEAVEDAFGVNVVRVRTIMIPGKMKRTGKKRLESKSAKRKKAMVTIKEGQIIPLFDVQEKA